MTEETRKRLHPLAACDGAEFDGYCVNCVKNFERIATAYELGEKAGRSEKKDSLSTKHLHETE